MNTFPLKAEKTQSVLKGCQRVKYANLHVIEHGKNYPVLFLIF